MTQTLPVMADIPTTEETILPSPPIYTPLRENMREFLRQTLQQGLPLANFYDLMMEEVEAPMLEVVLQYVHHNQSKAARILNLSRGTLRKKMRRYGLLPQKY